MFVLFIAQIYAFLSKIIFSLTKKPERKWTNFHYNLIVKLQNLISKKSVLPFQKQLFTDVLQSRCSKMLRKIHRKTPALESLLTTFLSFRPATLLKSSSNKGVFL